MSSARSKFRPVRVLILFLLVSFILGAVAFWPGLDHAPRLGLDLQGGTQITLIPKSVSGDTLNQEQLDQGVEIIRQRVDGLGVAEAQVTVQGSGSGATVIVSLPGSSNANMVDALKQTALLNFRPVEQVAAGIPTQTPPAPEPTPTPAPSKKPKKTAKKGSSAAFSPTQTTPQPASTGQPTPAPTGQPTPAPTGQPTPAPTGQPTPAPTGQPTPTAPAVEIPIADTTNSTALTQAFNALDCANTRSTGADDPAKWIVTCSTDKSSKYLLGPAFIRGDQVENAQATLPTQGASAWQVTLDFNAEGSKALADASSSMYQKPSPQNQFAIVLDGQVQSSPYFQEPILGGNASINGNFTIKSAQELAQVLKYGALPVKLEVGEVSTVSPTLGADQLTAGLIAGALGLFLVALYLILFYRALGVVALISLVVAGAITYASFIILGRTVGLSLTLAGVSGAIVAIGVTADSFIVYFERIRDEVRENKSVQTAASAGWLRARNTILAADFVSLLAAGILYYLSIGNVRGFAFVLGVATVIDLAVAFWFTRPLVAYMMGFKLFNNGRGYTGVNAAKLRRKKTSLTVEVAAVSDETIEPAAEKTPGNSEGKEPSPTKRSKRKKAPADTEPLQTSTASEKTKPLDTDTQTTLKDSEETADNVTSTDKADTPSEDVSKISKTSDENATASAEENATGSYRKRVRTHRNKNTTFGDSA